MTQPLAKIHQYHPGTDLTNPQDPTLINYKHGLDRRLHQWRKVIFRGELREIEYHTGPNRGDLCISVNVEYVRQPDGLLTRVNPVALYGDPDWFGRRTTRVWYDTEGNPKWTKVTVKTYDPWAAGAEAVRRRGNVRDQLKIIVFTALMLDVHGLNRPAAEADAFTFFATHQAAIDFYVEVGQTGALTAALQADPSAWLDTTMSAMTEAAADQAGIAGQTIRELLVYQTLDVMAPA